MGLTNNQIDALIAVGFNRWTKGDIDRLYINAKKIGLECGYYNTGNICSSSFNGEEISHSQAYKMLSAKTYVDIKTGQCYSFNMPVERHIINDLLLQKVKAVVADVLKNCSEETEMLATTIGQKED